MAQMRIDQPSNLGSAPACAPGSPEEPPREASPPPTESARPSPPRRLLTHLARRLPTVLVLALLGSLGAYGHYSDWKLPKFAALVGEDADQRQDWCEEHGVPASQCVECRPGLLPRSKDYGWCREHGVAQCPLCHPEVAQLKQTPVVSEADRRRAARSLAATPRAENNPVCKTYRRRIQFVSLAAVTKAGVDVGLVSRQPVSESVSANGQITYDQTRFASLSSRLPGTVWHVEKTVGQEVRAGEVLALIDAAEVGRAKSELIQALAQEQLQRSVLERVKSVADIVPGGKLQEAQAELAQAQARLLAAQQALANLGLTVKLDSLRGLAGDDLAQQLRFLGLPQALVEHLQPAEATSSLLPLKAPMDGIIVTRQVVAGEVVDASRVLFQLADTSRMWLTLSVSAEDAGKLSLGQPVRFRPDGSQEEVSGKLVWKSTTADSQTRMVMVRAELPNSNGQLLNETFGAGRVILREESEAITVPNEAIHWEGCCHVVFVRDTGFFDRLKVFHVRTVRLGATNDQFTEIIAGVLPGEVVATKGSDVLRAELLKNSLGEGCCAEK